MGAAIPSIGFLGERRGLLIPRNGIDSARDGTTRAQRFPFHQDCASIFVVFLSAQTVLLRDIVEMLAIHLCFARRCADVGSMTC